MQGSWGRVTKCPHSGKTVSQDLAISAEQTCKMRPMVLRPSYQDKRCNDLAKSSSMEQHSRQENREMAELPENEGGGPFDCAVIAASHLGLDPEPIRAQFTGENGVRSTKLYDAIYKQAEIRELSLPFPRTVTLRAFIEAHPVGKYCVLTNQRPGEYTRQWESVELSRVAAK